MQVKIDMIFKMVNKISDNYKRSTLLENNRVSLSVTNLIEPEVSCNKISNTFLINESPN